MTYLLTRSVKKIWVLLQLSWPYFLHEWFRCFFHEISTILSHKEFFFQIIKSSNIQRQLTRHTHQKMTTIFKWFCNCIDYISCMNKLRFLSIQLTRSPYIRNFSLSIIRNLKRMYFKKTNEIKNGVSI